MAFIYQIVFLIVNQERVVIFTQECSYGGIAYCLDSLGHKEALLQRLRE